MRPEARRPPALPTRRLALGIAALCAAALAASLAQAAATPVADAGGRFAYVDPGSGSFILQALVATLAGAAVAINAYWAKIKRVLGRDAPEEEDDATGAPPSDD